jgi:hypothetical protein
MSLFNTQIPVEFTSNPRLLRKPMKSEEEADLAIGPMTLR